VSDLLPFIIAGFVSGAIYGLAGTGLVITYKTSGIFNFAQPALAAIAAYVFYFLHYDTVYVNVQWPWPVAVFVSVLIVGPLLGLLMERIARNLALVATPLQVVAMIGLALGVIGALGLFYRNQTTVQFPQFLPTSTFSLVGTNVGWDQLILFLLAGTSVALLYVFFRSTRLGMAMRAVVDNPELMDLTGTSAVSVSRWAWIIGTTFVAASGVLLSAVIFSLSGFSLFFLMIGSFGAAAIGAFSSLPLTFVGGLVVGIVGSLATKWSVDIDWVVGIQPALPFLVLLVVLIGIKRSKLVDNRVVRPRPMARSYYGPWKVRLVSAILVVGFLALVPQFAADKLTLWGTGLIYMILVLSLGLLVKESGQVSLCQTGFAAVGGVAFAHSVTSWGLSWPLAMLFAGVAAAAVGLIVAVPAIRVSGVFLALATLGFGLALQNLFYPTGLMFGRSYDGLAHLPRPSFADGDTAFYYTILAFVVVISAALVAIHHGRLGRLLRGLGDSPLALNTMGNSVNSTRVIVFAISAFIAGIAGALYASYFQAIGLETPFFAPFLSLQLFAIVILVAAATPWYGLAGAIGLQIAPAYIADWFNLSNIQPYLSLLFGVSALAIAIQADRRPGLPQWIRDFFERFRTETSVGETSVAARPRPEGAGLEVRGLTVRFGGIVAVDGLDLHAPFGRITGLIGPNGAGKTTTFNACSGLVRPTAGGVSYLDRDVSGLSVATRARLGIGRTFQRAELWDSLSVRANVELGREAPLSGVNLVAQILPRPGARTEVQGEATEAMRLAGIEHLADREVGDLSAGQRRLVELARVLAGPFDLLLLDEPSSGLDKVETEQFAAVLRRIVGERGTGILIVEHDMQLVMGMCDYVYVMDFGRKIFEGTATEVAASEEVRQAYLGSEPVAVGGGAPAGPGDSTTVPVGE
jgi:ABC-type branched-subunit amino acid transport system ATPase component/ABC-type branched-subunit amino acid transport system permease subunit